MGGSEVGGLSTEVWGLVVEVCRGLGLLTEVWGLVLR